MNEDERASRRSAPPTPPGLVGSWPAGVAFAGGFRLLGSPLGSGSRSHAQLVFLSGVDASMPPARGRVLATQAVGQALELEKRRRDVLTLGYGRKLKVGRLELCLLPAGRGPGSALLEAKWRGRTWVFCDELRTAQPLVAPPAVAPTADVVLLNVAAAEPKPPAPKRAAAKLGEWIGGELAAGRVATVACDSYAAALDAAAVAGGFGVPVRASWSIYHRLRGVEAPELATPAWTRLSSELPESGIVLMLAHSLEHPTLWQQLVGRAAFVGPGRDLPGWATVGFRLGENDDRPGIVSFVKATGAREVALGPRCDAPLAEALVKAGLLVYRERLPEQMDLPF